MKIGTTEHESAIHEVPRYPRLQGLWLNRIGVSALMALIGFAFSEPACAKPAAPDLKITVRVYNYSQPPSTMLAEAEREAGRILGQAGLNSVWLDCPVVPTDSSQNPCPEPIEAADIRLRVFSEAVRNSLHHRAYGFAIIQRLPRSTPSRCCVLPEMTRASLRLPLFSVVQWLTKSGTCCSARIVTLSQALCAHTGSASISGRH